MGLLVSKPLIFLFTAGSAVLAIILNMEYNRDKNSTRTRILVFTVMIVTIVVALLAFFGIFRG